MAWEGVSSRQKIDLSTLYGPYLALAVVMGVDMYGRLGRVIELASAGELRVEGERKVK